MSNKQLTFIYPPTIEWDYKCFQRPHQLFKQIAKKGHKAYFCNKPEFPHLPIKYEGITEIEENLFIVAEDSIDQIPKDLENVVLYCTYPPTLKQKEKYNADITLFDYMDESVDEFSPYAQENEEAIKIADIVTVTSQRLMDSVEGKNKYTYLSRNGADIDSFLNVTRESVLQEHSNIGNVLPKHKPIIGFYGALQSWIDFELIKKLALERPGYNIALIGPDYTGKTKDLFENIRNVHLMGYIPYENLKNYSPFFDVGIIPFEVREMTKSSNPIKMYEYLAASLPVVSTDLPEARIYSDVVYCAEDYDDFIMQIDRARLERYDSDKIEMRRQVAYDNSWSNRVDIVISGVMEVLK